MLVSIWTEEPVSLTKYDFKVKLSSLSVCWVYTRYIYAEALKVVGTWFLAWGLMWYDLMYR